MARFWSTVKDVIEQSDVLLLLLDARMVEDSRNLQIEESVLRSGRPLIYVVTKCDLVEKKAAEVWKQRLHPCVFVSSTKYHGLALLRERIQIVASRVGVERRKIRVGVLGYPNVGKSSLVNAMTGRGAAQTSVVSGHTRSKKYVTSSSGIVFVDTPGVIPFEEKEKG
ncbi:MAG: GTPase, partial [Nanoarchaeota archaeon]